MNVRNGQERLAFQGQDFIADFKPGLLPGRTRRNAGYLCFFFRIERKAGCDRHRVRIKDRVRNRAFVVAEIPAFGVADLMAMHAALDHFPIVIESGFVLARQRRKILRSFEPCRARLFAGKRGLVRRVPFMEVQRGCQRLAEPFHRDVFGCVLAIRTRAEARIDRLVRVEKENGEGQIVIELEERQVQCVGLHQANTDKLGHDISHPRIATNNLFVKSTAVHSGDTPDHHEQRFARPRRLSEPFGQIIVNPLAGSFDFLAVIQDALFSIFSGGE